MANDVIKELGALEKQAAKQSDIIESVKANLAEEKKKYEGIISDILGLIRDENSGQEKIKFNTKPLPPIEKGKVRIADAMKTVNGEGEPVNSKERLIKKNLKLLEK